MAPKQTGGVKEGVQEEEVFTLRPEAWAKVSQERVRKGEEAPERGKQAHRGRGTGSLWLAGPRQAMLLSLNSMPRLQRNTEGCEEGRDKIVCLKEISQARPGQLEAWFR